MCFESIPSPGLEPPLPRLVIVPQPHHRVCNCGEVLTDIDERRRGTCSECRCRASILLGTPATVSTARAREIDQVLDRIISHPTACFDLHSIS